MMIDYTFQIFPAKLTTIIRYIYWKHWQFIRNYRFHLQHTKLLTFRQESNIACGGFTVQKKIPSIDYAIDLLMFDIFAIGFRLQSTKCMGVVDLWKKFQHSNVVQLREVFTTKSFGDQCKAKYAISCLFGYISIKSHIH